MRTLLALAVSASLSCTGMGNNGNPGGDGGGGGADFAVGGDSGTGDDLSSSGGSNDVPEYLSGTRIKARVLTTPDGAKQFLGWQDTMLNIACSFMPTPDGMVRCMPLTTQMATWVGPTMSSLYGDGNCQNPIATVQGPCPASLSYAYYMTYPTGANACDVTYGNQVIHVFAATGQVTGNIFYNTTPGNPAGCMTQTKNTGWTYWSLGAEVDYTTFAAGTVSVQ